MLSWVRDPNFSNSHQKSSCDSAVMLNETHDTASIAYTKDVEESWAVQAYFKRN